MGIQLLWRLRSLRSSSAKRRAKAAEKLGCMRDPRAVEPLITRLHHWSECEHVCAKAAEALGKIGDARAVEPLLKILIKYLSDEEKERDLRSCVSNVSVVVSVARALGDLGNEQALYPLIEALGSPDGRLRCASATALANLGQPHWEKVVFGTNADFEKLYHSGLAGVADLLIRTLKCQPDGGTKIAALLGDLGDPKAVEPLIKVLRDHACNYASEICAEAAKALGKLGDPKAVEPLIKVLCHNDDKVRTEAVKALGKLGDPKSVEPLIKILCHPNAKVRTEAVEALGKLGDLKAVEPLIKVLRDHTAEVRAEAAKALGKLGDPKAGEALITSVDDLECVRHYVEALGKLDDGDNPQLLLRLLGHQEPRVRYEAANQLKLLGHYQWQECIKGSDKDFAQLRRSGSHQAVIPLLEVLKNRHHKNLGNAIHELGKLGDGQAVDPLIMRLRDSTYAIFHTGIVSALEELNDDRAVEPLIEALDSKEFGVRKAAISALGKLGDSRSVEPLIELLRTGYREAATALADLGDIRAVEPLIEALQSGDAVSCEAAIALGKLGDIRAVEPLFASLGSDKTGVNAAQALGNLGDMRITLRLIKTLIDDDQNDILRSNAAITLGKLGDIESVAFLIQSLGTASIQVRKEAARALGELGKSQALIPLIEKLGDTSPEVRGNVVEALGKLLDTRAVEPLVHLLDDETPEVRGNAAGALGNLGDTRSVLPLITALSDREAVVRKKAACALGKLGDIRAARPLMNILNDRFQAVRKNAADALDQLESIHSPVWRLTMHPASARVRNRQLESIHSPVWRLAKDEDYARYYIVREDWDRVLELGGCAVDPLVDSLDYYENDVFKKAASALRELYYRGKILQEHKRKILAVKGKRRVLWEHTDKVDMSNHTDHAANILFDLHSVSYGAEHTDRPGKWLQMDL